MKNLIKLLLCILPLLAAGCKKNEPVGISVTGLSLNKENLTVAVGQSETLTATVTPENATNKEVTWAVTNGGDFAEIDANGKVTGKAVGSAVVTVTTKDGGKTATCLVNVISESEVISVTGLSLNKENLTVAVGQSETLTATVTPENATNKEVTWAVTNGGDFAEIDANGKVTGKAVGSAIVTVTTKDGSNISKTCLVTVVPAPVPVTGVSLDVTEKTIYLEGGENNFTLIATIYPEDATNKNVTWSVTEGAEFAEVDANGKVTAKAVGTAVVTATTEDGSYTDFCTVTVAKNMYYFSVASNKKVVFSPGNLWCDASDGKTLKWAFEETQYSSNACIGARKPGDLPIWYYNPGHISHFYNVADPNLAVSVGELKEADFTGQHFTDIVGFNVDGDNAWRMLTPREFAYLISTKRKFQDDSGEYPYFNEARNGKYTFAKISNEISTYPVLALFPDNYKGTIALEYTLDDWKEAEKKGAVCLPVDATRQLDEIMYMSNISDEDRKIYLGGMTNYALSGEPTYGMQLFYYTAEDEPDANENFLGYLFENDAVDDFKYECSMVRLVKDIL